VRTAEKIAQRRWKMSDEEAVGRLEGRWVEGELRLTSDSMALSMESWVHRVGWEGKGLVDDWGLVGWGWAHLG
jgi:hypothetical protein